MTKSPSKPNEVANLPKFSIRQLMEAGVHFGHKSMRRNPKMSRYIFGERNKISIIDLNKTAILLQEALKIVHQTAKNNGRILFVATKKQASEIVAEAANRCGQYFVNSRWLGGMLTNWKTVSQSLRTLKKIEDQLVNEEIGFVKKEKLMLQRQKDKLEINLGGIKNMGGYPDLIFIIDINKEALALAEAKKLKIPVMAIVDSNVNPDPINYPIPGNDDSAKAIKLYCRLISDAILEGIRENLAISGLDVNKLKGDSIAEKLKELKSSSEKSEVNNSGKKEGKFDEKKSKNFADKSGKSDKKENSEKSGKSASPFSKDSSKEAKPKKTGAKSADGAAKSATKTMSAKPKTPKTADSSDSKTSAEEKSS